MKGVIVTHISILSKKEKRERERDESFLIYYFK